jgi:hypothetical protein
MHPSSLTLSPQGIAATAVVLRFVTSVDTTNGGSTVGKIEQGDTLAITFSDDMNPQSFCSLCSTSGNQSLTSDNQVTISLNDASSTVTATVSEPACTFASVPWRWVQEAMPVPL